MPNRARRPTAAVAAVAAVNGPPGRGLRRCRCCPFRGDIILAPMRTGVGLRAGVNVGYMHYTRKKSWIPL